MKRIVFLDYIRVLACFLVILVHACENYYGYAGTIDIDAPRSFLETESDRLWVSVYDGFSRMAVPLFMIVSAFLLCPMREGDTAFRFYKRRAQRIVPAFLLFMVLYCLLPVSWNQIDLETGLHDMVRLPFNFPSLAGHLWFIYPLISIYLFIPVISPWLTKATKKEEQFFIVLFLLSTTMPYLNRFVGDVWGECFWNQYHALWYFSGYLGYLVLAHYIRVHLDWTVRKRVAVGVVLTFAGAIWTILSFYLQAVPGVVLSTPAIELGWSFCTINVAILTTGAFLLFTCVREHKESRTIREISDLSYGIYLMHIMWLGLWVSIFKDDFNLDTAVAIPVIALTTFLSCVITAKILSMIPYCRWMLGLTINSGTSLSVA